MVAFKSNRHIQNEAQKLVSFPSCSTDGKNNGKINYQLGSDKLLEEQRLFL